MTRKALKKSIRKTSKSNIPYLKYKNLYLTL